jgi:hypothetical protein
VFPEISLAFVDGTAPHVVEPKYPFVVEKYLDLGRFVRSEMISKETGDKLKKAFNDYKACYSGVYRCIKAARFVSDDIFGTVFRSDVLEKLRRRAKGIIKREIQSAKARSSAPSAGQGREIKRFLSAISPQGNVFLKETVYALCGRIYELNDTYGLSQFILTPIKNAVLAAGYSVFACYCPLNPENKLDHLLIPELSLGFVTVHSNSGGVASPYRRIHLDAYLDPETLKNNKQRLKFMRRTCSSLLDEAVDDLKAAKVIHDGIEEHYNPSVDFDGLYKLADEFGEMLAERYIKQK